MIFKALAAASAVFLASVTICSTYILMTKNKEG